MDFASTSNPGLNKEGDQHSGEKDRAQYMDLHDDDHGQSQWPNMDSIIWVLVETNGLTNGQGS